MVNPQDEVGVVQGGVVKLPAPRTLARYGLSLELWMEMLERQGGVCGVCGEEGKLVIDHEHVRGWKKMRSAERRKYVRGLCCVTCNHYILTRFANPFKHRAAADYLEAYERRRDGKRSTRGRKPKARR